MLPITCIILTYNERLHIRHCIERIKPLVERIIVIDSISNDGTQDIARECGAEVIEHKWPGNQAAQFNWALDNVSVSSPWILRLDADEYLTPELIKELEDTIPALPDDVAALSLPRAKGFRGRILKHGIAKSVDIVRLFRTGSARYENRIMDEHLIVNQGRTIRAKNKFVDDTLMPISDFIAKHVDYANREARILFEQECAGEASAEGAGASADQLDTEASRKRRQKSRYARMPLYWRAFGYFIYRYFLRLGFLDGREGFLWDFIQGWWYRTLVDARLEEMRAENRK